MTPPIFLATLAAGSCLAGLVSAVGHACSVGAMQAQPVASITVGIPSLAPFWLPAIGFVAGNAFHGLLLALEAAFDARRARRRAVATLIGALEHFRINLARILSSRSILRIRLA